MPNVPTIETPRLRLRPHDLRDLEASAAMWADADVTRFIGTPSSPQQSWSRMRGYAGLWAYLGYGYWAVEEAATQTFIGEVGFADFKRDIAPAMCDVPELGWALAASAHGKGYATEAARAALLWGDANLPSTRTVCMIDVENLASIRVAEKCGFRHFDSAVVAENVVMFFERYRDGGVE